VTFRPPQSAYDRDSLDRVVASLLVGIAVVCIVAFGIFAQ
jgi:hypothetical protein